MQEHTSSAEVPVVIVGAPAGNHLAVGQTKVAVPLLAESLLNQMSFLAPAVGFEKVNVQALPEVNLRVKHGAVDQSIVRAVVH